MSRRKKPSHLTKTHSSEILDLLFHCLASEDQEDSLLMKPSQQDLNQMEISRTTINNIHNLLSISSKHPNSRIHNNIKGVSEIVCVINCIDSKILWPMERIRINLKNQFKTIILNKSQNLLLNINHNHLSTNNLISNHLLTQIIITITLATHITTSQIHSLIPTTYLAQLRGNFLVLHLVEHLNSAHFLVQIWIAQWDLQTHLT
jgi:hypothetical protein